VQPLRDNYLHSYVAPDSELFVSGNVAYIYTFSAIGIIILLLACINFVNLATARAVRRSKEVGLRKTIGASRLQLVHQFLLEGAILCGFSFLFALALVQVCFPLFTALCGKNITFHFSINYSIALLLFYVLVVLLSGFYPAFVLSSFGAARVFRGAFVADNGKRFREAMLGIQFTVSAVMIICAVIISQQLTYINEKDLGFDKSQLMYVKLKSPGVKKQYQLLLQDIQQEADIESISATTANLVDVTNGSDVAWQGMKQGDQMSVTQITVDENFMHTTGMKLAEGRNFSNAIVTDSTAFIINQTAADRMNFGRDAIGRKLSFWNVEGTVIGVVKDFNYQPLTTSVQPLLLRYRPDEWHFNLLIKTKPNKAQSTIQIVQKLYKKYDKDGAFEYGFVDQALDKLYTTAHHAGNLINGFAAIAIFISCIGLFGLVAYAVEQRTKEIGIRKVLGANLASIVRLLSRDFTRLLYLSLLIALPIAYYFSHQWLQNFVYRVSIQWWQLGVACAAIVVVIFFVIFLQVIRTMIANPVKSLRTE
jgi:ABC-type antimicrobial peptide transport system permease subunit